MSITFLNKYEKILTEGTTKQIQITIRSLLKKAEVPSADTLASMLASFPPERRLGILKQLAPQQFLSENAFRLHSKLKRSYPELLDILSETAAFRTAFPATGIPAQSRAIDGTVQKKFNAGIGVAKTEDGDILLNSVFEDVLNHLKCKSVTDDEWRKIRNCICSYTNGLGAPWYRTTAKLRYLSEGSEDESSLRAAVAKNLRINPIPVYGGTAGLNAAFEIGVGSNCPIIFPTTYWGNMNLKGDHIQACKVVSDWIDRDARINPEKLAECLYHLKERKFKKAAVYFNFPHNPTGVVPTHEEAEQLARVIHRHASKDFKIIVICDEPYYPFLRGYKAIDVPFSYYMHPGTNRNILCFVSINGTKRDGMYGFRHSDLIILTPENIKPEAVEILEKDIVAGYLRGAHSFSNVLNQYLLAWAISGNPKLPLEKNPIISLNPEYKKAERIMCQFMKEHVESTIGTLNSIPDLEFIGEESDLCSAGGFFICFRLSEQLHREGITALDVHKAGLKNNCGIIATNDYIRINALIRKDCLFLFKERLERSIEDARIERSRAKQTAQ
jgi:aspartate/methionine/tyrosine aminotransferase